jgi:hypothetical protein
MEACLVELLWLLEKSPHFQVGPTCHAHIWFLPPLVGSHAWCAGGGGVAEEGRCYGKVMLTGGGGATGEGSLAVHVELCPAACERSARPSWPAPRRRSGEGAPPAELEEWRRGARQQWWGRRHRSWGPPSRSRNIEIHRFQTVHVLGTRKTTEGKKETLLFISKTCALYPFLLQSQKSSQSLRATPTVWQINLASI